MKPVNHLFSDLYLPQKALLIYRHQTDDSNIYVEAYDMDTAGKPVNAHPLAIEESAALFQALDCSEVLRKDYLKSRGLLPEHILHLDTLQGSVLWHTPPQETGLFFKEGLSIPCGKAHVPAMLWKADKENLQVFAPKGKGKPKLNAMLYHAPFFNLYDDGRVCMGTVAVNTDNQCCLEEFTAQWEQDFFGSYFSHLIENGIAASTNIVQLWQRQVNSGRPFPEEVLIKSPVTIKDLIR